MLEIAMSNGINERRNIAQKKEGLFLLIMESLLPFLLERRRLKSKIMHERPAF
jgi:hypothetical protein